MHVPLSSNVPEPTSDPEWWRFLPIALVAVVVAPLFEEFVFRGLLLRSLRSKLALWPSIVIQGALFALAHMQPGFGWGNVGLVVLLAWVGSALGYAAHHFGRIWPGIVAHATINFLAIAVLIVRAYW
jgi:uncharacterized protein